MSATAHRTGLLLYFFVTPSHARQFEIIHTLGLAQLYLPSNELSGVGDFGSNLTLETLEDHFTALDRSRRDYLLAHIDFVASIAALHRGALAAIADENLPPRRCLS